jgi:nucleoid-associated protein YgaU
MKRKHIVWVIPVLLILFGTASCGTAPPTVTAPPPTVAPAPAPAPPPAVATPPVVAPAPVAVPQLPPLPAQYTVRPWSVSRDSFWVISSWPWVYNDPLLWRILYEANRERLPQPDNPDLIFVDMILDIPSIRGEARQGMWMPN